MKKFLLILSNATCLVCGGGRKNKFLMDILKKNLNVKELILIDSNLGCD